MLCAAFSSVQGDPVKQTTFASVAYDRKGKVTRRERFLSEMDQVIPWGSTIGRGDKQGLLTLSAEDIEWIIPGEDWPLAGTHRGRAGLADVLQKASEEVDMTYPNPPEFVAQGDRVLLVGVATGKIKATNKPFKDDWVFDITVRDGKLTNIREYIDTQALARASQMEASGLA
jgi:ketosteroid isomerase-like protein